jgi:hypothetical protein
MPYMPPRMLAMLIVSETYMPHYSMLETSKAWQVKQVKHVIETSKAWQEVWMRRRIAAGLLKAS